MKGRQRAAERRLRRGLRVSIVKRHAGSVRQEPPEDFAELELRRQSRRQHQTGHRGEGLPHVVLRPGTEGDLRTVQRAESRGRLHRRAVGETLNPHRATGWIVRRLHQFLRKRADDAHAVRLEEAEEIRVPIAEGPVEHRRLGRIDHPSHAVGSALQISRHGGLAAAGVRGGQFLVHVKLPHAGKRMGGDRQDAAGGRSPDTVEDGIDEIGEVPGDRVAAVLPAKHRFADG